MTVVPWKHDRVLSRGQPSRFKAKSSIIVANIRTSHPLTFTRLLIYFIGNSKLSLLPHWMFYCLADFLFFVCSFLEGVVQLAPSRDEKTNCVLRWEKRIHS